MRKAELLPGYLSAASRRPFRAAMDDCGLLAADWVFLILGKDPAAHLRKRYRSKAGFMRLAKEAGGLLPLMEGCANTIPLPLVSEPEIGDIGLVEALTNSHEILPAGAIWTGREWITRATKGLFAAPATPLRIWRV